MHSTLDYGHVKHGYETANQNHNHLLSYQPFAVPVSVSTSSTRQPMD